MVFQNSFVQKVNTLVVISVFVSFFLFVASSISGAQSVVESISRSDMGFDEQLSDQSEIGYREPNKLIITQVTTQSESLSLDSQAWVQSIYYYSITRLGFADTPFTYFIDRNGNLFQGRSGYVGAVPELKIIEGVVLIGYLSNSDDITPAVKVTLNKLFNEFGSAFGISRDGISVVNLSIVKGIVPSVESTESNPDTEAVQTESPALSKLEYTQDNDSDFSKNFIEALRGMEIISKVGNSYIGKISDISIEPQEVIAGEKFKVKVSLENLTQYPWYLEEKYLYISTQSEKNSPAAINGSWDSFVRPTHIAGGVILPNQKANFEFPMQAVPYPQEDFSEKFKMIMDPNISIKDSEFEIKVKVLKGVNTYVQIVDSIGGYLNVRDCGFMECKVIDTAISGSIYKVIEEDHGWYKIELEGGVQGWVGSLYAVKVE